MFAIKRKELINNLEKMRRGICLYHPDSTTCDCKYGKENEDYVSAAYHGERFSGCPEIRLCISLLNSLTDEEYTNLLIMKKEK
jgi:hypothetical protein